MALVASNHPSGSIYQVYIASSHVHIHPSHIFVLISTLDMLLAEKKIRLPLKSPFIEWDLRYLASYHSYIYIYIKVRFPADILWLFGPVIFGSGGMSRGNRLRVSDLSINQIELQGGPPI